MAYQAQSGNIDLETTKAGYRNRCELLTGQVGVLRLPTSGSWVVGNMHIKLIWDDNRYPRPRFGLNRSHRLGRCEAGIATGESAEMCKKR